MAKKILMIVASKDFRDEELFEPKAIFEKEGFEVVVTSPKTGKATGMLGGSIDVKEPVSNFKGDDFNAVVVVGGMGSPEFLWENSDVHSRLKEASIAGKVVAGICLSGAVLAKAGVINGKRATVWPDDKAIKALKDGGAVYDKCDCVRDGRVVTGEGPHAAAAFGKTIVAII